MLSRFKQLDWPLILIALAIAAMGLISLFGFALSRGDFSNFTKQLIFLVIGFCLMLLLSMVDWRVLSHNSYLILILYFLCLAGLIGLFFFAPLTRGVRGWYRLGPVSIDPVEFTKLGLIILLAKFFSMRHIEMYRITHILISGGYVLLPAGLVFFQPNLGSALILLIIWLVILVISGIKIRHFLILCLCGILVFVASWLFLLKDYQKQRVIVFFAPHLSSPLALGWHQSQAKIAIGEGGLLGQGIGRGSQAQNGFLPEPQTDFIFAMLAEELGLGGVSVLLLLFLILLWRIIKMAIASHSNFPRLFASGVATLIFCQLFINIGMNLGLLPIIGISLPLVSYGGSGLIADFMAIGILQSIRKNG